MLGRCPIVSRHTVSRYGTPIRTRVSPEVAAAILGEAGKCKRSVDFIASELLRYWYEDVYLPARGAKKKPPGGG